MSTLDPQALYDDVIAEHEELLTGLHALSVDNLDLPTPDAGWSIRDQISHLAFFEDAARLAVSDPGAFAELRQRALPNLEGFVDAVSREHRSDDHVRSLSSDDHYRLLLRLLASNRAKQHFNPLCREAHRRYELPSLRALNFLLEDELDGSGLVSLRMDAQGKAYALWLLEMSPTVDEATDQ